jgi:peptide/nickel transport system permease protein
MGRFLAVRLVSGLATLLIFITLLFFVAHTLMAADFVSIAFFGQPVDVTDPIREALGLDQPVWQRYLTFLSGLVTGDFGSSFQGPAVSDIVARILPWTALVFTLGMGIGFAAGHKLGRVIAWHRPSRLSNGLTVGSIGFHTLFPPLLAFLLIVGFRAAAGTEVFINMRQLERNITYTGTIWLMVVTVGAFGVAGGVVLRALRKRRFAAAGFVAVILALGGPPLAWVLLGKWAVTVDILFLLTLPIIAVALLSFGEVALTVDSVMAGVASEDFILTARAKGLSERDIRDRHAARVSLLPVLSKLVVTVPFFLTGLVIIEAAFRQPGYTGMAVNLPGLSTVVFGALQNRNVPVTVGALFAVGLIMLAARIALDVAHAYLDPRIRYGKAAEPTGKVE